MDKVFASFNTLFQNTGNRNPIWRHNIGPITSFYGDVAGAGMAVSFNEAPSQNKILKSISIEGTNNMGAGGIVLANNSTGADQAKESPAIAFQDRGGIMYGQIQGQNTNSNSNVRFMGTLLIGAPDAVVANIGGQVLIEAPFQWADGGLSNVTGGADGGTTYVMDINGQLTTTTLNDVAEQMTQTYAAVPQGFQFNGYDTDTGLAQFSVTTGNLNAVVIQANILAQGTINIYTVTPNDRYGDNLRGQYADAIITFGAQNWEMFALNLEYEPTNYDHRKSSALPSAGRAKRRRRR